MKVIHIITGLNGGGAEGALCRLVTHAENSTEQLVISFMDMGKYGKVLQDSGVEVIALNMPQGRLTVKGLVQLYNTIKKYKPDVVQTWLYHADFIGGIITRIAGCKKVFWGIRTANLSAEVNTKSTLLAAKLCAFFSTIIPYKVIYCAQSAVPSHKEIGYKGEYSVIPNGYNFSATVTENDVMDLKRELRLENTEVIFGVVARWDPIKDHANLFNALSYLKRNAMLDNFVCVVVGEGCDLDNPVLVEQLEDLDLKDNVRLMGFRKDIPVFMSMFDLVVLPSKGEGFPNVLAEAMVYGAPCVSTNVGDAKVIIGDTGWVVEPSDHQALAKAISKALIIRQDAVLWRRRKNDCHERITQNFSMSTMVSNYLCVWAS